MGHHIWSNRPRVDHGYPVKASNLAEVSGPACCPDPDPDHFDPEFDFSDIDPNEDT